MTNTIVKLISRMAADHADTDFLEREYADLLLLGRRMKAREDLEEEEKDAVCERQTAKYRMLSAYYQALEDLQYISRPEHQQLQEELEGTL